MNYNMQIFSFIYNKGVQFMQWHQLINTISDEGNILKAGADWTCRPTALRAVGPWHNHAFFINLYVVKHI